MYTFQFTESQLEAAQDLAQQQHIRILRIICEDQSTEDHYYCVIDCEPHWATLLYML